MIKIRLKLIVCVLALAALMIHVSGQETTIKLVNEGIILSYNHSKYNDTIHDYDEPIRIEIDQATEGFNKREAIHNLAFHFWMSQVTQSLKIIDLLVPLLVVVLGATITFFITIYIENRRQKWELKREVYFEIIDIITKVRKVIEDNKFNPVSEDPEADNERKDREIGIAHEFVAAKAKAYVGGSKELNRLLDERLDDAIKSDTKKYQKFLIDVTNKMTKELSSEEPTKDFWRWLLLVLLALVIFAVGFLVGKLT